MGASGAAERGDRLSAREREIALRMALGCSAKEDAAEFGRSIRTIETHRNAVRAKLGARSAAAVAVKLLGELQLRALIERALEDR